MQHIKKQRKYNKVKTVQKQNVKYLVQQRRYGIKVVYRKCCSAVKDYAYNTDYKKLVKQSFVKPSVKSPTFLYVDKTNIKKNNKP